MLTRTIGERRRGPAERDWADVRAGRPIPVHHVVTRDGDEGLEVLRMPLGGRGETVPVFSAGWAACGYLFAEAPGGGWYVKTCTPGELFSLLAGSCARVEWVALDPKLGPRGGGRGGKHHAAGELRGLPVVRTRPLVAPRERARDYRRRAAWTRERSIAKGGKPWGRQRCCWIWRSRAPAVASSWVAEPRGSSADARKQPSRSLISGRHSRASSKPPFRKGHPPQRKTKVPRKGATHPEPGNSGMEKPSHIWIISLYKTTGTDNTSDTYSVVQ